jgi:hypothetical protein
VLPSGKVHTPISLLCLYNIEGLFSYRIIQEREDLFVFQYVPTSVNLSKKSIKEISKRIERACLGEKIFIEFEKVDETGKGRTGKRRSFISKVKRPVDQSG